MKRVALFAAGVALAASYGPVSAQPVPPRESNRPVIQNETNATGGDAGLVISRGATGADTINTDSAAGGNASRPEQAFPNGSAGGGGGGR